jgi:hypothetical protein
MVILMVVDVAHVGAAVDVGVKVYVCDPTEVVLMTEGLHVPAIPFEEVVSKLPGVAFWQYGPSCENVGEVGALMVTLMVVDVAHVPAVGVNV